MHRKTIDPVTGRMFTKHSVQDDLRDRRKREKEALDSKIKGLEGNPRAEATPEEQAKEEGRKRMIKEFDLDAPVSKPDKSSREWIIARSYAQKHGNPDTAPEIERQYEEETEFFERHGMLEPNEKEIIGEAYAKQAYQKLTG